MKVAIHQPNYIPWIGFFSKMKQVDKFVLLDTVKHSKSSVTHRNKIKTANGEFLLSVSLKNKESIINELLISDNSIIKKHWNYIEQNYKKSTHWEYLSTELKSIYFNDYTLLNDFNIAIIKLIKDKLRINTELIIASDLDIISGTGSDRNLEICKKLGATIYISGKGAKAYNDIDSFHSSNISLEYTEFIHPKYTQLYGEFISHLSAIDLIFNEGSESYNYI